MAFRIHGTSVNGGAVTLTIPSGSNFVALMAWFYEDGGSGGTPTVPGGATATSLGTPAFQRAGAAYKITGLSAGSATFDPPGTNGGNQACIVMVFDDASDIDGYAYATPPSSPFDFSVSTPNANDFVALIAANPTTDPALTSSGGSTTVVASAAGGYGGRVQGAYIARSGATTSIGAGYSGTGSGMAVRIVGASGGPPAVPFRSFYDNF